MISIVYLEFYWKRGWADLVSAGQRHRGSSAFSPYFEIWIGMHVLQSRVIPECWDGIVVPICCRAELESVVPIKWIWLEINLAGNEVWIVTCWCVVCQLDNAWVSVAYEIGKLFRVLDNYPWLSNLVSDIADSGWPHVCTLLVDIESVDTIIRPDSSCPPSENLWDIDVLIDWVGNKYLFREAGWTGTCSTEYSQTCSRIPGVGTRTFISYYCEKSMASIITALLFGTKTFWPT